MKKPKFKLLKEFKDFISRGSVLDLAVGMIIGAAFTAIITAVVTNILQPLINLIPVSDTGLITVLREAVLDKDGNVVTEALVINWGAVISAIITFLLTALVLFAIVKAINTAKAGANELKEVVEEKINEDEEAPAEPAQEETPAEESAPAEAAPAPELENVSVELLKEIRDLLKAQQLKDNTPKDAE